jgi:hypothetical protein
MPVPTVQRREHNAENNDESTYRTYWLWQLWHTAHMYGTSSGDTVVLLTALIAAILNSNATERCVALLSG